MFYIFPLVSEIVVFINGNTHVVSSWSFVPDQLDNYFVVKIGSFYMTYAYC